MSDTNRESTNAPRNPRRRRWLGLGLGAGLASAIGLGLIGGQAYAHWGRHGGHFGHQEMSQEKLLSRMDYVLDCVDADPAQREQIKSIVGEAWQGMDEVIRRHRANRTAMSELLQAPQIDRNALRALRDDELDLVSGASNRLLEALADAAEVLSVEQRKTLADLMARHAH